MKPPVREVFRARAARTWPVRSLGLLAALLLGAPSVRAQAGSRGAVGLAVSDTSETSTRAKGLPWIAHSSADAYYLPLTSTLAGSRPYQVSAYQGVTIQSLAFASFHAGWRYRETLAPEINGVHRDLFTLKLMGTAELLRNHFFVSLGGSIPLFEKRIGLDDSADLYRNTSEYSPLPAPNFVTPQALLVGISGRYELGPWDLLAGMSYTQPTRFEPIAGEPFHPASHLATTLRVVRETKVALHRVDFKASVFGMEETIEESPAHREGGMWQLRYAWLRAYGRVAWQLGGGGAVKAIDANRVLLLRSEPEPAAGNDNLQRAYLEGAWTWSPKPSLLWRAWLVPRVLMEWSSRETGSETELGLSMGMRVWEVHRLRASGTIQIASFKDKTYLGLGTRVEFSFRRLGFQDLESQPASGGEGGGD